MPEANSETYRVVERQVVIVDYLESDDDVDSIHRLWPRLEATVGQLRGRHFYGTAGGNRYRACVVVETGSALTPGLQRGEIPGGCYARMRLKGEPPGIYEQIPPGFDRLGAAHAVDGSRPNIEYYRRRNEIDLLLPVR